MRRTSALACAGVGFVAVAALTGCSQIDSLQQVSGVPVNTLQIATNDLLVQNKVQILEAPKCVQAPAPATTLTCAGSTVNGQKITVTAKNATAATFTLTPGGTPTAVPNGSLQMTMVLKVGNKTLYTGPVQAVIQRNAVK